MLKKAGRWSAFVLTAVVLALGICAAIVYAVDPFEHYRESSILPLYDQESYNNPGIVKNYDYDAVIIGTSMVEMSHASVIDECFGVHSVKLPMRGSVTAQMGWQLSHALAARPLKAAILGLDAYSLQGRADDATEIYDYLWNDSAPDDVNYLLNLDVLVTRVPKMLRNRGKSLETKRDDMYQWTDVEFSRAEMLSTVTFGPQNPDIKDADYREERTLANLRVHLIPYIEAHPETTFYIYFPPYSVAYWYQTMRGGILLQQEHTRELAVEYLAGYENVRMFDYSARVEWITNLDNYFDFSHHCSAISDEIMRAMAAGECRVTTVEQVREGNVRIEAAVQEFLLEYEPAVYRE